MKLKSLALLFTAAIIFSCNNKPAPDEQTSEDSIQDESNTGGDLSNDSAIAKEYSGKEDINVGASTCYWYIKGKDTTGLTVTVYAEKIEGALLHISNGIIKDSGTIKNIEMRSDTLVGDYTYKENSKELRKQIAFLIAETTATEGAGKMEKGDSDEMIFANMNGIKFNPKLALQKGDCR